MYFDTRPELSADAATRRLWDTITQTILRDDPNATCEWFLGCYEAGSEQGRVICVAVHKRHHEQDWLPTRWEGFPVRVTLGGRGWHDLG